jgi:pSer/pThr/pTyr-binding forkhead associated (FHA) protein
MQQPQRQQISEQLITPPSLRPVVISVEKTMMPLIIQYGPAIRSYNELPVVIGSDATADFVLQYPGISGRHLQLFYSRTAYWIKNLTGVGIVSVNREKLEGQVQLKPFDEIECCPGGPMFRFIGEGRLVEVEQAQPAAAPWIAQNTQNSTPVVNPVKEKESGGFFSKLVKGFK